MTGFNALPGDTLPAGVEKLTARGAGKIQVPGAKADDKASRAFGTHLSRLAQENESKLATSKSDGQQAATPVMDVRPFAVPSRAYDERTLTSANAKIFASLRISEETENQDPDGKADTASDAPTPQTAEPSAAVAESRPSTLIHHAAMGFIHEIPAATETKPASARPDDKGRAGASDARSSVKTDDVLPGTAGAPRMPSEAIDFPDPAAMPTAEQHDLTLQHSSIRSALPTKIAVVSQETHFEPVLPSATLQQIANSIGEEMPISLESAKAAIGVTANNEGPAKAGPVKMLTLQLDPASLGSVTVTMKLTGAAIEVQISAGRAETAQLLEHDRGALSRLLQASGYEADISTVQVQSIANASNGDAGQSASNFQGQPGQSSAQGQFEGPSQRAGDERQGAQQNQQERRQFSLPQEERNSNDAAAKSGTIYL